MHVEQMKRCTRVKAPRHTVSTDIMTFNVVVEDPVMEWLENNNIWDWDLIAEDDGDHGPLYVFYFANEKDAIMFSLRWLS